MMHPFYISALSLGVYISSLGALGISSADATTGYFQLGNGAASTAMGGASIAWARGPIGISINPAGLSLLSSGLEMSIVGFAPSRGASLDTQKIFGSALEVESENSVFFAPHLGFSLHLDEQLSLGISIYSSGGMNTEYRINLYHEGFSRPIGVFSAITAQSLGVDPQSIAYRFVRQSFLDAPHTGTLGISLEQAVITPSLAYQMNDQLSLGFSLLIGAQRFQAQGLGDFVYFSDRPLYLTNNDSDYSFGLGARVGALYQPLTWLHIGAVVSSKVYMSNFSRYQGLFADQGNFDIPAHFGLGIKVQPLQRFTLSADVTRIMYEGVSSISNSGPNADQLFTGFNQALTNGFNAQYQAGFVKVNEGAQHPLGSAEGYGFGWRSIWVGKVGANLLVMRGLELMTGYAYGQNPVPDQEALFNLIAPAVTRHHITGGVRISLRDHHTFTLSYQRALFAEVSYHYEASSEVAQQFAPEGQELGFAARSWMSQDIFELSYGYQF